MSRGVGLLLLLAATSCGGRWVALNDPSHLRPATGPRRDFRVVLRNDSSVILLDAIVRNDSIVELPNGQTALVRAGAVRSVALADADRVELWQPAGERVAGGLGLGVVAALLLAAYAIGRAIGH